MKAVMLGAGNAAFHIAPAMRRDCGVEWVQVFSRTLVRARELGERIACPSCIDDLALLDREADLYVLAVRDEAIPVLAAGLHLPGKTVLHVAGAVPLSALQSVSAHHGVMYFFQTFSRQAPEPDFRTTPVCLEASDPETAVLLETLARGISEKVCFLSSRQRGVLHLSGVFACNYVNFMYTAAYDLLKEQGLDFSFVLPLIEQTARKVQRFAPDQVQTGPAVRNDRDILERHRVLLAGLSQGRQYSEMYDLLARLIEERYR